MRYLDQIRELETTVSARVEARARVHPTDGPSLDPQRDCFLMEMLADLYYRVNITLEAVGYEKLPRPSVGGSPTASRHYVLAL